MKTLPEEVSFETRYGKIAGLRWGSGNKNKILALHGWLDNAASFWHLAPFFAAQGYEITAIDFPGHGHSDHRAEGHFYGFIDYVLDLQDVLEQINDDKIILLCHSMGAAIAQMYAAAFPEKIAHLILIENMGPIPAYKPGTAAESLKESLSLWSKHNTTHNTHYNSVDEALQARVKATPLEAEIIKPMIERGLKLTDNGYHWRTDKRLRLRSLFRLSEEQIQDILSSNKTCTHLLIGEPRTYALSYPKVDERIQALNPDFIDKIEGGHHLHMSHAKLVFETINARLAKN